MEQPGEPPISSSRLSRVRLLFAALAVVAVGIIGVAAYVFVLAPSQPQPVSAADWITLGGAPAGTLVLLVIVAQLSRRANAGEVQARHRVRQAEDKLSNELRASPDHIRAQLERALRDEQFARSVAELELAEALSAERQDDRLTLAALWDVTHSRMDLYHQIVTGQAKRSFGAAQVATAIGFVLLVVFAVLAAEAKTTTAAISAGGLGAVGAAFAAYIGKTFIRSQESAASHLRAYFDQPLELSRYLAAERLLADAADLTAEQRAAIVSSLVQSIATAGHQGDKSAPRGRRGRLR